MTTTLANSKDRNAFGRRGVIRHLMMVISNYEKRKKMELELSRIASQQFAKDYLLVMMNDQASYNMLMMWADGRNAYDLAELIREDYEERIDAEIGTKDTATNLLMRQLLLGWGIEPFIYIARSIKEDN
jgi:hypothetical protein